MKTSKKVLLTFIGNRDPFNMMGDRKSDGPILSLLNQWEEVRELTGIGLFYTLKMDVKAKQTQENICARFTDIEVSLHPIATKDPTNYQALLSGLRQHISELQKQLSEDREFWIATSSGSPQMQTCWFLLAASREISAHLVQVRETKDISEGQNLITFIDPQATWFPIIWSPMRPATPGAKRILPAEVDKKQKSAIENLGIIGSSKSLRESIDKAVKAAATEWSVIIFGEMGTGKESLARLIHDLSCRSEKPFITIDCGSFTETLIESEIFGHERAAFTGAAYKKVGLFEMADGGTLFLDEIGNLSKKGQADLLRVVQEQKVRRVGGTVDIQVDVRVIAATNRDLGKDMDAELFREDLYYRLNVIPITLSPLRERRDDIRLLIAHFLKQINEHSKIEKTISSDAIKKLEGHHWPGNIRELKNAIERAWTLSDEDEIDVDQFNFEGLDGRVPPPMHLPEFYEGFRLDNYCSEIREALVSKALSQSRTQREAAKLLGVSGASLSKRKKRP